MTEKESDGGAEGVLRSLEPRDFYAPGPASTEADGGDSSSYTGFDSSSSGHNSGTASDFTSDPNSDPASDSSSGKTEAADVGRVHRGSSETVVEAVDVRRVTVSPEDEREPMLEPEFPDETTAASDAVSLDGLAGSPEELAALEAALLDPRVFRHEAEEAYERLNDVVEDVYWIAHITATATSRAAKSSLWGGVRTGVRMLRAAGSARSFDDFVEEYEDIAVDELERRERKGEGEARRLDSVRSSLGRTESPDDLMRRGERLLEMSADVDYDASTHPAFSDILDQIAPDEARILRLLAMEGPQPSVNVRDAGWLPVSSELVAAGLSMVGTEAGLIYEHRTQAYLNNLNRLGLVWFCDEPVKDVKRYQLVEAQPDVKQAIDSCKRAKIVRRSIHLTPFGIDFCRVCLPVDVRYEDASGVYDAPINRTERGGSRGQTRTRDSSRRDG